MVHSEDAGRYGVHHDDEDNPAPGYLSPGHEGDRPHKPNIRDTQLQPIGAADQIVEEFDVRGES